MRAWVIFSKLHLHRQQLQLRRSFDDRRERKCVSGRKTRGQADEITTLRRLHARAHKKCTLTLASTHTHTHKRARLCALLPCRLCCCTIICAATRCSPRSCTVFGGFFFFFRLIISSDTTTSIILTIHYETTSSKWGCINMSSIINTIIINIIV